MVDLQVKGICLPKSLNFVNFCSDEVGQVYKKIYSDMSKFVKTILKANVRVLLYYGDTDMVG